MSVWKNAAYKDDAIQELFRAAPRLVCERAAKGTGLRFTPGACRLLEHSVDGIRGVDHPAGASTLLREVLLSRQSKDREDLVALLLPDAEKRFRLAGRESGGRSYRRFGYDGSSFRTLLPERGNVYYGINGVYKFYANLVRPGITAARASVKASSDGGRADRASKADIARAIYAFGSVSSGSTPVRIIATCTEDESACDEHLVPALSAIRELIRIRTFARGKAHESRVARADKEEEECPPVGLRDLTYFGERGVKFYVLKDVTIVHKHRGFRRDVYVLTRTDIERIERLTQGFGLLHYYVATYQHARSAQRGYDEFVDAFKAYESQVIDAMLNCSPAQAQYLCKAADVVMATYSARLASDISDRSYLEQRAKALKHNLDAIIDVEQALRTFSDLRVADVYEILQIYKILPQPDFDYFSMIDKQIEKYEADPDWGVAAEKTIEDGHASLRKYIRFFFIQVYHNKFKRLPGVVKEGVDKHGWLETYPHCRFEQVDPMQTDLLDFTGCLAYKSRHEDMFDLVKDKAIPPKNPDAHANGESVNRRPAREKTQLLDVLFRDVPINMDVLRENVTNLNYDVRGDDKPEAKKPDGRMFFIMGTEARLVLSEQEDNIADLLRDAQTCMSGKGLAEKERKMNHLLKPPTVRALGKGARTILISFDLKAFSPTLRSEVHRLNDDLFAEAYDQPHQRELHRVFSQGRIHYWHRNMHASMDKMGRDFEGFCGRKNTFYHAAVMGFCCYVLLQRDLIVQAGRFVALIDDGLLRVDVKIPTEVVDGVQRETISLRDAVTKVVEVIEEVYAIASLYISWDKTYISTDFCTFLNDIRYQGAKVNPGSRAFLKIGNRADVDCPGFCEDLAYLDSTIRGTIAAGANVAPAYYAYAYFVADLLYRWAGPCLRRHQGTKYALAIATMAFSPHYLGGLGVKNHLLFCGSLATESAAEAIGVLKWVARFYPVLIPYINVILNAKMLPLTPLERIRNPAMPKADRATLKNDRMAKEIYKRLLGDDFMSKPALKAVIGDSRGQDAEVMAEVVEEMLRSGVTTHVEILKRMYNLTVHAAIESVAVKFLRANSAKLIISFRGIRSIGYKNRKNAREVVEQAFNLVV